MKEQLIIKEYGRSSNFQSKKSINQFSKSTAVVIEYLSVVRSPESPESPESPDLSPEKSRSKFTKSLNHGVNFKKTLWNIVL